LLDELESSLPSSDVSIEALGEFSMACFSLPSRVRPEKQSAPAPVVRSDALLVAADAYPVNSKELLEACGLPASSSAAEIIATLYRENGEAGLDQLDGEFAFAVFDASKNRLICRRDVFGVRPFYYTYKQDKYFAFSSMPKPLVKSGLVDLKRDWQGAREHLGMFAANNSRTLVKGLKRLNAANQLDLVGYAAPVTRCYWKLRCPTTQRTQTYAAWTAGLKQRFEEAVRRRLPETGVLGAQISAGLDSTSVVMMAASLLKDDDQTIFAMTREASSGFKERFSGEIDETEIAKDVAKSSNRVSWQGIPHAPDTVLAEPLIEPDKLYPGAQAFDDDTAEHAARIGADVVLTGWGGDQAVTYRGSAVPAHLMRQGKWRKVFQIAQEQGPTAKAKLAFIARNAAAAFLPGALNETLSTWRRGRWFAESRGMAIGMKKKILKTFDLDTPDLANVHKHQCLNVGSPSLALRLEYLAGIGYKEGVRFVHPMLDRTLVAYSLTCPPEFHYRNGRFRAPIRDIMEGIVPDSARERREMCIPLREIILEIVAKRDSMLQRLSEFERDERLHDWFDFKLVRRKLEALGDLATAEAKVAAAAIARVRGEAVANEAFVAVRNMALVQSMLDEEKARQP